MVLLFMFGVLAGALGAGSAEAATVSANQINLIYTAESGEANRPAITFSAATSTFTVTESAGSTAILTAGAGCTAVSPTQATCPSTGLTNIGVSLNDQNDVLVVDPAVSIRTSGNGGAGNDTLTGGGGNDQLVGDDGDDTLNGGEGNDSLIGGAGADTENGGAGNDSMNGSTENDVFAGGDGDDTMSGGAGADTFGGGLGIDTVLFNDRFNLAITADLDGAADDGPAGELDRIQTDVENLTGSNLGDTLTGNSGANTLIGGGFADGNDVLTGGDGPDVLMGADGNDTLNGDAGDDTLDGGEDVDTLLGGAGNDTMTGGAGADFLQGAAGADVYTTGTGGDHFDFSDHTLAISITIDGIANDGAAGEGDNVAAATTFTLGSASDSFVGASNGETIHGGNGADTLNGGGGNDTLEGGPGSFILDDEDVLIGGAGTDTADYSARTAGLDLTIDGAANDGRRPTGGQFGFPGERDTIGTDIERVHGGSGGDDIVGSGAADTLNGNGGNDDIDGGNGDDSLDGADGIDDLNGADGNDILSGGGGNDTLTGGAGPLIISTGGNDNLDGGLGTDTLNAGGGDDVLSGGPGGPDDAGDVLNGGTNFVLGGEVDTADFSGMLGAVASLDDVANDGRTAGEGDNVRDNIERLVGSPYADTLVGSSGPDIIEGGDGWDTNLSGGDGDDVIRGGDGVDLINGDGGNDTLDYGTISTYSGGAANTINGGPGVDTLEYGSKPGQEGFIIVYDLVNGTVSPDDEISGVENIVSGPSNDTLIGNSANNVLDGGKGADLLIGNGGSDTLIGGSGTIFENGSLIDVADFSAKTASLSITQDGLANDGALFPAEGDNVAADVERIIGGSANDTIIGGDIDNILEGGGGANTLNGGLGNDMLLGGLLADSLNGGGGTDTVDYVARTDPVTIALNGAADDGKAAEGDNVGADVEILIGGAGADAITANDGPDELRGNGGNDVLDGGLGADEIDGGTGNDTVSYATRGTGQPVSVLLNDALADGGADDAPGDVLTLTESATGGAGNDTLTGTSATNFLDGGAGADRLDGLAGGDAFTGGPGDDGIRARDGQSEAVDCGAGIDWAWADLVDTNVGGLCERFENVPPTLSVADVAVAEGNSGTVNAVFTVTQSFASVDATTVAWATVAGTAAAGEDFQAANGTLTFAPDELTKSATVAVNGDAVDELNETFTVHLSAPTNATIVDADGTGTITDDDAPPPPPPPPAQPPAPAALPSLTISNAKVKEGNRGTKGMKFFVRLSVPSAQPVTLRFKTQKGTAKPKSDFVGRSFLLTFAPGQVEMVVVVKIKGDLRDERNEKFKALLLNAVGATIADALGIGSIRDND